MQSQVSLIFVLILWDLLETRKNDGGRKKLYWSNLWTSWKFLRGLSRRWQENKYRRISKSCRKKACLKEKGLIGTGSGLLLKTEKFTVRWKWILVIVARAGQQRPFPRYWQVNFRKDNINRRLIFYLWLLPRIVTNQTKYAIINKMQ